MCGKRCDRAPVRLARRKPEAPAFIFQRLQTFQNAGIKGLKERPLKAHGRDGIPVASAYPYAFALAACRQKAADCLRQRQTDDATDRVVGWQREPVRRERRTHAR